MNQLVAPTSRMIEISRARWSRVSRMVTPMITTATAANASPITSPTMPATLRRWSSFCTQSRPNRTSSTKLKPRSRCADALHGRGVADARP